MTNSIEEVKDADVLLLLDPIQPRITRYWRQGKTGASRRNQAHRCRSGEIELSRYADVYLQIKPGTNVALINGLMNVILNEGLEDQAFIEERTENFEELKKVVMEYTPERVAEICRVDPEDIRRAARLYGSAERASILYAMGITQHSTGTQHVMSVANLAMLCGNLGKEGVGVNPLRGQNNVQGACDMGALPGDLPGYQKVNNPEVIEKFEKAWGVKLSTKPGLTIPEMLQAAEDGRVKLLYIMGENPMVSDRTQNMFRKLWRRRLPGGSGYIPH